MSLYGYKKKHAPANWTTAFPSASVKAQHDKEKAETTTKGRRVLVARKRIQRVSRRSQFRTEEYKDKALRFVMAAIDRGERCSVVASVPELRAGRKYGHPISDALNEVHHMRGRAGSLLTDERHWMAVSKQGHRWVHEHPAEARERGWFCPVGLWNVPDKIVEKNACLGASALL